MNRDNEGVIKFNQSYIKRFSQSVSFSDVVNELSRHLLDKDLVTNEYAEAVKQREDKFPTGLPTSPIGTAIPHTDPQYVKQNAVSVAILDKPINMKVMASENEYTDVSIIFLLALGESNRQLNILQNVMKIVQNQELLQSFFSFSDEQIEKEIKKAILEED